MFETRVTSCEEWSLPFLCLSILTKGLMIGQTMAKWLPELSLMITYDLLYFLCCDNKEFIMTSMYITVVRLCTQIMDIWRSHLILQEVWSQVTTVTYYGEKGLLNPELENLGLFLQLKYDDQSVLTKYVVRIEDGLPTFVFPRKFFDEQCVGKSDLYIKSSNGFNLPEKCQNCGPTRVQSSDWRSRNWMRTCFFDGRRWT